MKLNLNQRVKARLAQRDIELNRHQAHAKIAKLLRDKEASKEIISKAKEQIQKWRDGNLCSPNFIHEWEMLLENPIQAADILEAMSPISIRLRQNSPFSAYLKP